VVHGAAAVLFSDNSELYRYILYHLYVVLVTPIIVHSLKGLYNEQGSRYNPYLYL